MAEWYELRLVAAAEPKPGELLIASAAVRACGLCGEMIDGMGGPGHGSICVPCGQALLRGNLRGTVRRHPLTVA